jgi:site-specific recombinase XerC
VNIEIHDAVLEARIQKRLQTTGSASVEEVLLRLLAILALLIGCDLRLAELVGLGMEDFQVREEHWVIADLIGNGKHLRTVPVPAWVKGAVDEWTDAANRAWRLETVWSVSWYMGTTTLYCPDRHQTTQPRWRLCGTGPSSKLAR